MERGYVRLYRKKLDSDIWQYPNADRVFEFLMLSATYRPHKYCAYGTCIDLLPGQYISSIRVMAQKCRLSLRELRTSITYLKSTQRIAQQATHQYSVFTILNWDCYQNPAVGKDTPVGTLGDTGTTQERHSDDTGATQKQELKEFKEGKEEDQKPKPRRAKRPSPVFVLPDSIRPEVWEAFEEHRRKKRSPMTDHARALMVKACQEIGGDPNTLLEHAILSGWQKVFPIKGNGVGAEEASSKGKSRSLCLMPDCDKLGIIGQGGRMYCRKHDPEAMT